MILDEEPIPKPSFVPSRACARPGTPQHGIAAGTVLADLQGLGAGSGTGRASEIAPPRAFGDPAGSA
eukprot:15258291-Alexandrium_andersonii.AAC.1